MYVCRCPQDIGPDEVLNRWQEGAVRFITHRGGPNSKTPLLLLYGPFGTGKTYTLANGMMNALKDKDTGKDTRILICTHTNRYVNPSVLPILTACNWQK